MSDELTLTVDLRRLTFGDLERLELGQIKSITEQIDLLQRVLPETNVRELSVASFPAIMAAIQQAATDSGNAENLA